MFKPHHLELFYYVARHGGISAATRHIPYGIGQPAISGQMSDFERQLGVQLFERKPFRLTVQGELMFAHVGPFFEGLGPLWEKVQAEPVSALRIAVDAMIAPSFLGAVFAASGPPVPGHCIELETGPATGVETWLHERRVHVALTLLERRVPGLRSLVLARWGLRLLVARRTKIVLPGHFWRQGRVAEPLICPAAAGAVGQTFARGLRALGVEWPVAIRVNSSAVMRELVATGRGVGLDLDQPGVALDPGLRAIPLAGFATVALALLWRPTHDPRLKLFLAAVEAGAGKFWPGDTVTAK